MLTIKVGSFPGEIKEVVVERNSTVEEILNIAGVDYNSESAMELDGSSVQLGQVVAGGAMLLVTKRLKSGL
jgi:hypothetical protein